MEQELYLRFGSLRLRLIGETEVLRLNARQRRFLEPNGPADVTVRILRRGTIPPPEGRLLWETSQERVFSADGAVLHYFRGARYSPTGDFACLRRPADPAAELELQILQTLPLERGNLLNLLALERLLHQSGQALLHASCVLHEGTALLFSGDSGVGKSTQAELWRRCRGARIINGDKIGLGFPNGRLTAFGTPFSGSSVYCENCSAPVRAVVVLARAPTDSVRRLSGKEAARLLTRQMPCQKWSAEDVTQVLEFAVKVASDVPVYLLSCTKEESVVTLLERTLTEGEASGT